MFILQSSSFFDPFWFIAFQYTTLFPCGKDSASIKPCFSAKNRSRYAPADGPFCFFFLHLLCIAYIPFLFIVRYSFFLYPQPQNVPPDLKTRKTSR